MRRPRFPPSTTSPAPEPHNVEKIAWIDACHSRSYSVFCCRATNLLPLTSRFRLTAASCAFGAMISGLTSIGSIRACCRECFGRSFGKVNHTPLALGRACPPALGSKRDLRRSASHARDVRGDARKKRSTALGNELKNASRQSARRS